MQLPDLLFEWELFRLRICTYFLSKKKTLKVKKCNWKFDSLCAFEPPINVDTLPSRFKECLTSTEISENIRQDLLKNTTNISNALFFNKILWHWLPMNDLEIRSFHNLFYQLSMCLHFAILSVPIILWSTKPWFTVKDLWDAF